MLWSILQQLHFEGWIWLNFLTSFWLGRRWLQKGKPRISKTGESLTLSIEPLDIRMQLDSYWQSGEETSNIMEIFVKEHIFSHEKLTLQMFLTSASSYLASKRRCLKNINYQPCNDVGTQNEVPIQSIISHGRRWKSRCLLKRHTIRKSAENSTSCSIMNY